MVSDKCNVLPPVSKLTIDEAVAYFGNGYTMPYATNAMCECDFEVIKFNYNAGLDLMPSHLCSPIRIIKSFEQQILKHKPNVYLLNTGCACKVLRSSKTMGVRNKLLNNIIDKILDGSIDKYGYRPSYATGLMVPKHIDGHKNEPGITLLYKLLDF